MQYHIDLQDPSCWRAMILWIASAGVSGSKICIFLYDHGVVWLSGNIFCFDSRQIVFVIIYHQRLSLVDGSRVCLGNTAPECYQSSPETRRTLDSS